MKWTNEPPSVAGWYWLRFKGEVCIREFTQEVVDQIASDEETLRLRPFAIECFAWSGPILEPTND